MRQRLWAAAAVLVVATGIVVGWSASLMAAPYPGLIQGRADSRGYFTNIYDCGGHDVWPHPAGVDAMPVYPNANAFIADVENKYYFGNPQQHIGAAFIIQTMRGGVDHTDVTGPQLTDWENRVRYAESQGWIQWNAPFTYTVNTRYQGPPTNSIDTTCGGGGANPIDDAYFGEPGPTTDPSIVFSQGGTFMYALRRACANPLGNLPGIPGLPPAYDLRADVQPGSDIPASKIIEAGGTYHLTPVAINSAAVKANGFTVDINNLNSNAGHALNVGASSTAPATGAGYFVGACYSGSSACWPFSYGNGLAANTTNAQTNGLTFKVDPNTPENFNLCFSATVWFSTPTPFTSYTSPNLCFTVLKPHYPGVIGLSGDVHAGGALCGQSPPASNSALQLNPSSNSYSEYVVSANGTVSGYGSNNVPGGAAATIGNYSSICRPDLVATAKAFFQSSVSGTDYASLGGGTYDVGGALFNSMPGAATGIYIHNGGGNVVLHGTFTRKITIVMLTGDLIIDSNLRLGSTSKTATNVPSLGIIAANDININGAATQVDAYLFANGTINTCVEGNTPACLNTLNVNGFLMSKNLLFRRLGPKVAATTATVGERINLTGQLYLNPPKFFDNAANVNLLQNQGEKPPLN